MKFEKERYRGEQEHKIYNYIGTGLAQEEFLIIDAGTVDHRIPLSGYRIATEESDNEHGNQPGK